MLSNTTDKEHKKRIDATIDYILKNLNIEIKLETLSDIANYSPFHFQKLFKKIIGQSPKQYIIKLRLETALHLMFIHPNKSIQEISIDCGFSSPAVFSRSVKNYFGASPEELRKLPSKDRKPFFKSKVFKSSPELQLIDHSIISNTNLNVSISKIEAINGIYLVAPFDDSTQIQHSFIELVKLAASHDISIDPAKIYGILSPHQGNIYKTFIAIEKHFPISNKFNRIEIKAGKYASFKVKGDKIETLKAAQNFYHNWLSQNGYKIADIIGFERFSESPTIKSYAEIEREIYVPIEPIK